MTEADIQIALATRYECFRNKIFPNIHQCGGEMDLAIVTQSNYLWEIEIKLTKADWKRDEFKYKWRSPDRKWIKRFYYAVPEKLLEGIPDFVPESAGLLGIRKKGPGEWGPSGYRVRVHREAENQKVQPIPADMLVKFMGKMYWRFWENRLNSYQEKEAMIREI